MLNTWIGQGRLTKDIELRYTASNLAVATFVIACERDYKPQNGDRETDFINVVAFGKDAEFVSKYFHQGDMMNVKGRIQVRKYQDREGNNRRSVEIAAENIYFGGSKKSSGQAENHDGNTYQAEMSSKPYGQQKDFMSMPEEFDDANLPFQ